MSTCHACGVAFGWFSRRAQLCAVAQGGCGHQFCATCLNYACLTQEEADAKGANGTISQLCRACFQTQSSLDFDVNVEILEDTTMGAGARRPCVVFVHGAGGCRRMFIALAREFQKRGFRAVLMDLPGHGARMDEPLTLDSAIAAIVDVLDKHTSTYQNVHPLVIGGSLGGYILMELLGRYPDRIGGAIVAMCGQNVGKNRSLLASIGLWSMEKLIPMMTAPKLLASLLAQAKSSGAVIPPADLLEISLRPGMFFHQATAHVAILRQSDPLTSLPRCDGPIWFVNGTKDHRDSEQKWVACSKQATLTDYEGGDHFFSHDEKFAARFHTECIEFAQQKVFHLETSTS